MGARVQSWGELARRERALQRARARGAALSALRTAASTGGARALLEAVEAGADPIAAAIVAWELCGSARQAHPALSARRRLHLERYCAIADRLLGAGAGARYLLELILGHDRLAGEQVCSLDYFVCQLRQYVRRERRRARGLEPVPFERSGWYEEREERLANAAAAAAMRAGGRRRARVPSDEQLRLAQLPLDLRGRRGR